jgi:hypothetical protein
MKKEEIEKINPILKETFQPLFEKGFISKEEYDEIITSEISSPDTYLVNLFGQSWILRFVLCHPFRCYSARHFGLICATLG